MLVGADDGRINEQMFHIGISPQRDGHTFPDTFLKQQKQKGATH